MISEYWKQKYPQLKVEILLAPDLSGNALRFLPLSIMLGVVFFVVLCFFGNHYQIEIIPFFYLFTESF